MTSRDIVSAHPMGNDKPVGNYPPRQSLSPPVAHALAESHYRSGLTYRQAAAVLGVSAPYWWRLCQGQRAPSKELAAHIIEVLGIDEGLGQLLMEQSVDR